MSKYDSLGAYLQSQPGQEIPLSFKQIARITGHPLPASSRYAAWWSNNPFNNVMTKVWLKAGFKTQQVDVKAERVVFRRVSKPGPSSLPSGKTTSKDDFVYPSDKKVHPAYGAMKGTVTVMPGVDLTEPADPDWGKMYGE